MSFVNFGSLGRVRGMRGATPAPASPSPAAGAAGSAANVANMTLDAVVQAMEKSTANSSGSKKHNAFMGMWNSAKNQALGGFKRVQVTLKQIEKDCRAGESILQQMRTYGADSDSYEVQDALSEAESAFSAVTDAVDVLKADVDDAAYKLPAVLDGELTGQIQIGSPANTYLNEIKNSLPNIEKASREAVRQLKLVNKALQKASALIKRDYERRMKEAEKQRREEERLAREQEAAERKIRMEEERARREEEQFQAKLRAEEDRQRRQEELEQKREEERLRREQQSYDQISTLSTTSGRASTSDFDPYAYAPSFSSGDAGMQLPSAMPPLSEGPVPASYAASRTVDLQFAPDRYATDFVPENAPVAEGVPGGEFDFAMYGLRRMRGLRGEATPTSDAYSLGARAKELYEQLKAKRDAAKAGNRTGAQFVAPPPPPVVTKKKGMSIYTLAMIGAGLIGVTVYGPKIFGKKR